jgi:hypothetical protein
MIQFSALGGITAKAAATLPLKFHPNLTAAGQSNCAPDAGKNSRKKAASGAFLIRSQGWLVGPEKL